MSQHENTKTDTINAPVLRQRSTRSLEANEYSKHPSQSTSHTLRPITRNHAVHIWKDVVTSFVVLLVWAEHIALYILHPTVPSGNASWTLAVAYALWGAQYAALCALGHAMTHRLLGSTIALTCVTSGVPLIVLDQREIFSTVALVWKYMRRKGILIAGAILMGLTGLEGFSSILLELPSFNVPVTTITYMSNSEYPRPIDGARLGFLQSMMEIPAITFNSLSEFTGEDTADASSARVVTLAHFGDPGGEIDNAKVTGTGPHSYKMTTMGVSCSFSCPADTLRPPTAPPGSVSLTPPTDASNPSLHISGLLTTEGPKSLTCNGTAIVGTYAYDVLIKRGEGGVAGFSHPIGEAHPVSAARTTIPTIDLYTNMSRLAIPYADATAVRMGAMGWPPHIPDPTIAPTDAELLLNNMCRTVVVGMYMSGSDLPRVTTPVFSSDTYFVIQVNHHSLWTTALLTVAAWAAVAIRLRHACTLGHEHAMHILSSSVQFARHSGGTKWLDGMQGQCAQPRITEGAELLRFGETRYCTEHLALDVVAEVGDIKKDGVYAGMGEF